MSVFKKESMQGEFVHSCLERVMSLMDERNAARRGLLASNLYLKIRERYTCAHLLVSEEFEALYDDDQAFLQLVSPFPAISKLQKWVEYLISTAGSVSIYQMLQKLDCTSL